MSENIPEKRYLKLNLEELSLFRLRKIGREVGVKAPTALNKKDLIQEIVYVLNGEKDPTITNRGRPCNQDREFTKPKVFSRDKNIDREMLLFKHQIKIEIDQFVERINNLIEQFEENIKIKR